MIIFTLSNSEAISANSIWADSNRSKITGRSCENDYTLKLMNQALSCEQLVHRDQQAGTNLQKG
jgi:hypothetical protein